LDTAKTALPDMAAKEKVVRPSKNANEERTWGRKSVEISDKPARTLVELRSQSHEPGISKESVLTSGTLITAGTS
ncbi:hypothetical protein, partial [Photorhabdus australis]|uniref:hypothetical protein n=1 Tax=Photorhabdus australis TaxID=286156 RepID=UPI001F228FA9